MFGGKNRLCPALSLYELKQCLSPIEWGLSTQFSASDEFLKKWADAQKFSYGKGAGWIVSLTSPLFGKWCSPSLRSSGISRSKSPRRLARQRVNGTSLLSLLPSVHLALTSRLGHISRACEGATSHRIPPSSTIRISALPISMPEQAMMPIFHSTTILPSRPRSFPTWV